MNSIHLRCRRRRGAERSSRNRDSIASPMSQRIINLSASRKLQGMARTRRESTLLQVRRDEPKSHYQSGFDRKAFSNGSKYLQIYRKCSPSASALQAFKSAWFGFSMNANSESSHHRFLATPILVPCTLLPNSRLLLLSCQCANSGLR